VEWAWGLTALFPQASLLELANRWMDEKLVVKPQALPEPFKVRMISKS